MRKLYFFSVFISSFLLFFLELMIAKFLLPWFGGSPSVWTTAMMFFQTFLLLGYLYAHFLAEMLSSPSLWKLSLSLHLILILISILSFPVLPSEEWQPSRLVTDSEQISNPEKFSNGGGSFRSNFLLKYAGSSNPLIQIILILLHSTGLPFLALSSTTPLLSAWYAKIHPSSQITRLYSISNLGSLSALLAYPFLIEPLLGLQVQAKLWQILFLFFGLLLAVHIIELSGYLPAPSGKLPSSNPEPPPLKILYWLFLPFISTTLLLSFTGKLCQDVAVIPFLWILPLATYLLSFVITFENEEIYEHNLAVTLSTIILPLLAVFSVFGFIVSIFYQILIYTGGLFLMTLVLHGELARTKPAPAFMTLYYLMIALGSALASFAVSVLAPLLFNDFYELHAGILLFTSVIIIIYFNDYGWLLSGRRALRNLLLFFLPFAIILLTGFFAIRKMRINPLILSERSFFGVLRVVRELDRPGEERDTFYSGNIIHGWQFLDKERRNLPSSYYARESGAGLAIRFFTEGPGSLSRKNGIRVGDVGLGIGTIASYGRPGDFYKFYELNPSVVQMAGKYFSYLADSKATVEVVTGDGRLLLEREPPQNFDVLVLDAFSSDAIPVHLLTVEAFRVYLRHLAEDGIIVIQISNNHLDLEPVIKGVAEANSFHALFIPYRTDNSKELIYADWMAVTKNIDFLEWEKVREQVKNKKDEKSTAFFRKKSPGKIVWTDDYSNLFEILR